MTDRRQVIDILNELLRQERGSLVSHLLDSTLFVSRGTTDQDAALRRIAAEIREHEGWLAETIASLHGGVAPSCGDVRAAGLHYQEVHFLLPLVIENESRVIRRYEAALKLLAGEPGAAAVASRILSRHRKHMAELRAFVGAPSPAS
ncbi:MAG: hypothetical protein IT449_09890 [Phycisphaerales bacterium]|nr:hypothetical protein [Phycisphaerales bacterium]